MHQTADSSSSSSSSAALAALEPVSTVPAAADASPDGWPLAPPLPRFAQVEPVGRCNLACRMCAVNERGDEVAELSVDRFRALLDAAPTLQEVHLQGLGEPLLHPRFFDMVALAVSRGLRVTANTNLTLLTESRARRCVESGLSTLFVSIDGASAEVYEAIRRKASFAKVVRNLDRLAQARERFRGPVDPRSGRPGRLSIHGVTVLMRGNLEELPALARLMHAHGADEWSVQRLARDLAEPALPTRYIPIADYVSQAELRADDLPRAEAVFARTREVAGSLGLVVHLPPLQPRPAADDGRPRCTWPWDGLYVTAAGELLPCCIVGTADVATLGRVFPPDQDPAQPASADLAGPWQGPAAQAFRRGLRDGDPAAVCRGCALYHHRF